MMRVLILILFVVFIGSCKSEREGEIHLLPQGYTGGFVIVYQDSTAPPLPLVDGYYIYNIPENGILYTSTSINDGSVITSKLHFYHKQEGGGLLKLNGPLTRPELGLDKVKNTIKKNELYVFSEYVGVFGKYAYSSYIISEPDSVEKYWPSLKERINTAPR